MRRRRGCKHGVIGESIMQAIIECEIVEYRWNIVRGIFVWKKKGVVILSISASLRIQIN